MSIASSVSNRRHLVVLLLGFASGLPAALVAGTLQAWLTAAGIDLKTIGAATLLILPYSFRFLWSSVFDHYQIPLLDRRRGWLLVCQIALILSISYTAFLSPVDQVHLFGTVFPSLLAISFLTAFLSSSQDVIITAYQTEILPAEEKGLGAALYVTGWRIGIIVSGALALVMASEFGWHQTYLFMAALMTIGIFATCIGPSVESNIEKAQHFLAAVINPFIEFFSRLGMRTALLILFLIMTYKAGEALALALNTTFLLREIGFSLATIGLINKTVSIVAGLLGGLVAGVFMRHISLYRALLIFGVLQAVANLGYAVLAIFGKNTALLVLTAFAENFCSGLGSIALLALIMSLCDVRHTATQFALLSALAFMIRPIVGPMAAVIVEQIGWTQFFVWTFLLSLPTLIFVYLLQEYILTLKK